MNASAQFRLPHTPLEKRRKPGLGRYNAPRRTWRQVWREARRHHAEPENSQAHKASDDLGRLLWKACLILWFERDSDRLGAVKPADALAQNRVANEMIQEIIDEQRRRR